MPEVQLYHYDSECMDYNDCSVIACCVRIDSLTKSFKRNVNIRGVEIPRPKEVDGKSDETAKIEGYCNPKMYSKAIHKLFGANYTHV